MIIELYGLPATGKTYLAKKIEQISDHQRVKIINKSELICLNIKFVFKHPFFSLTNLWLIMVNSRNYQIWRLKFINCFMQYNAKYEKAVKMKKAIVDQGHHQNIISIFNRAKSKNFLRKYIHRLPPVDFLVISDLSPVDWEQSIRKRGYFARDEQCAENSEWVKVLQTNYQTSRELLTTGVQDHLLYNYHDDFEQTLEIIKTKIKDNEKSD